MRPGLSSQAVLILCLATAAVAGFEDPAPPQVNELAPITAAEAQPNSATRFHGKPKPLPADAVTSDWPWFLGPTHNAVSPETRLLKQWPQGGPKLVWEMKRGAGYASPSVQGDYLVYFHRLEDEKVVICLQATTGMKYWELRYPTQYRDDFGYSGGPRASPLIDRNRVYTMGVEGKLHCLELSTGRVIWQRNLMAEFNLKKAFFGVVSTPLLDGDFLIINVGAPGGPCVVAFNKTNGRVVWGAGDQWGAAYASPVVANVHGRRRLFVFAGGKSQPPVGGLISIDPVDGAIGFRVPWRSKKRESANAANPVIVGNRVLITASYQTGSALIEVKPDLTHELVWKTDKWGSHWNTPIYREGHYYVAEGRNMPDAALICVNAQTGNVVWRDDHVWDARVVRRDGSSQKVKTGLLRASLLWADGHFLCVGEAGHLLWLDLTPSGYKELSRTWLFAAPETWNVPVVSRGLLYVCQNQPDRYRGIPPRLLCYDLRAGE